MKCPKSFSSKFIAKMEARKEEEQQAEEEKQHIEELERIAVCVNIGCFVCVIS